MTGLWHALATPWDQLTMQRGMIEVVLLGVSGGALGCWIVFYDASYSAESLPHAMFPGLVLAGLTGVPLVVGGALGLMVAAVAVALAGRIPLVGRDTAVGVVVTALFGVGVLLALSPESPAGVQNLLFGDVLGLTATDLVLAGGLAVAVVVALRVLHTRLMAVAFDRLSARSVGARPLVADLAVLALIAVAVLVAVQALGNLLVVAVLVAPAATARLFCRRMVQMMICAASVAIAAGIGGLYASYYLRTAAGASIAGALVVSYLLARGATGLRASASMAAPALAQGSAR